jgi:hypothetical protein
MSARNDTPELSGALGGQIERRGSRRTGVLAQQIILVDVAPLDTGALLSDLSEDGLALQFGMPVPAVPDIEVSFPLDEDRVTARCALAWSSPTAWGLKFIELADKDKAKIRKWLERSTPHDWPTPNGTLPAAEDGLPEIAIASSSPQRAATADVADVARAANIPKPPPESGAGASPGDNRGDGISPRAVSEDWVARLMTRQKLAHEERLSAVRKQHDEGVSKQVPKAPPPPAQSPEPAEFDRAIRELRAATTRDLREIPGGPLTLIRGGVADRETKLRRVTPVLSVVFGLAVIALGACVGFLYATRVSPPTPFPLPSAELGFGSVRAEGRFVAPALADSQPRRSGEFLALGDNCLDGKKTDCSCSTAVECFRAAAMLGHPGALERLATLYSTGECVSTNRVQAYRAFQQALASDPNPWVQWNLDALWERMTSAERTQVSPPQRR